MSDARLALEGLIDRCGDDEPRASRAAEVAELRSCLRKDFHRQSPEAVELIRTLRSTLPRETIIVCDLTVVAYWCHHLLDVFEPRTYFNSMGFGTLGFGLPAAIGAKLAVSDRPVVVLAGDGGFQFTCQELATAVQFGVPVVVFNDNGYGILRPQQEGRYGRTNAADLRNPDFVALAHAFGASGRRVEAIGELGAAIKSALDADSPSLIEVPLSLPCHPMEEAMKMFMEVPATTTGV